MDYDKIISSKMKDMEVSPHKRKSMSVDALKSADHTSVTVEGVRRKYRSVDSVGSVDTSAEQPASPPSNEDIEVKLIRNRDRSQDASDPVGERTIIFNKGGGIMGSQG